MKYDFLIVGAGFAGAVLAERLAAKSGKKVLVIDKRDHIGGNCFDYKDENAILIHKYGPHIFHTNSKKVWDYLCRFTEWEYYYHRVLAFIDGEYVPVPFNFNSIYQLFPPDQARSIEKLLLEKYDFGLKIPILKLRETDHKKLKFLAEFIYKKVFLGYTMKQWNLKPEELDFSVSSRVPVFLSKDDRYFQDKYQGIPINGYTKLFQRILNQPNIELRLETNFRDIQKNAEYDKLIYTGTIDSFFDYKYGELPYRSLEFNFVSKDCEYYQPVAQVNYPENYDFTRITEFKHFLPVKSKKTTIAEEYPCDYRRGVNEPYYPIPKDESHELFQKYKTDAEKLKNVYFCGRLAEYKYYNMDQIVGVALQMYDKISSEI